MNETYEKVKNYMIYIYIDINIYIYIFVAVCRMLQCCTAWLKWGEASLARIGSQGEVTCSDVNTLALKQI